MIPLLRDNVFYVFIYFLSLSPLNCDLITLVEFVLEGFTNTKASVSSEFPVL